MPKVWFVTGSNSGIGAGIVQAAIQAGDQVVATARNIAKLRTAFPDGDNANPGPPITGRSKATR